MKLKVEDVRVEVANQLPEVGELAYFNNKIWKVCELWGLEIIHLQRPSHEECISLYGTQLYAVKKATLLAN